MACNKYHGAKVTYVDDFQPPKVGDQVLRDRGFRILSRPRNGEPVWVLRGREYSQSEAERYVALIPHVDEEGRKVKPTRK